MTASQGQVQILQVPDCPLVARLRALLDECLMATGRATVVEQVVGQYPSPTLLIDGIDVATGHPIDDRICCRLDLPSRDQIMAALERGTAIA